MDLPKQRNNSGKPFEPGDSRINRRGRPKSGDSITDMIRSIGMETDQDKRTRKERVARRLWSMAEKGYMPAIQAVLDRSDGKVKDKLEVEGKAAMAVVEEIIDGGV